MSINMGRRIKKSKKEGINTHLAKKSFSGTFKRGPSLEMLSPFSQGPVCVALLG